MKVKNYIMAKPDRPNWQKAVERTADLLREDPNIDLVNSCQNVPLKYLDQLRADAEKLLTSMPI